MGLAEIQRVVAQLYTNTILRERFFADPQSVGQELGLCAEEIEQVAQLSVKQVTLFANSLHSKRFGELRHLLPLATRLLGKQCFPLFLRYAETYNPTGVKKHREDALHFANFLAQLAQTGQIEPDWMSEVIHYEKNWLSAGDITRHLVVGRFSHAIGKLLQSVERGDTPPVLIHQPTLVIWMRLSPHRRLWRVMLAWPAKWFKKGE